ncbi:FAD-dependent oxidoreductase [Polymorphum gilvum]|uniref:BFD domain protein (2Fe-2S)-binding domain protein n=1 Tax=Polymorphum gilvum (strain LMG 25793 / CGMCC 1.9160 / SL003B-26A1) TaxID=991905 RepID=F2IWZ9_POLGS|nr:FAD-dependent oxidoreductase [Polymorphum gilvum]ADZ71576.1 BFD domain protein (2Fe-2S)-binding domain protein [Polymorphum gilvum SL003B-26A1]
MSDLDVLVIGGGPAGMAAAVAAARSGLKVDLVEQRSTLGGAIYRLPMEGAAPVPQSPAALQRRDALLDAVRTAGIRVRRSSVFLGIDAAGLALVEDRQAGRLEALNARAVILALGAVEKVLPRPGWDLPGVVTAGGLQVMMKETGRPPQGRVLLAGSGPLLLALAAQMIRMGNPPVAVVEAGDPLAHPVSGAGMLAHPALMQEAAAYLRDIVKARVLWMRGTRVQRITAAAGALVASVRDRRGGEHDIVADRIALHDGIRSNDFGLPADRAASGHGPIVLRAGDCREALGAVAAEADGRRTTQRVTALLTGEADASRRMDRTLASMRHAQTLIGRLFAPVGGASPLADLPDETVLCRCEGRTVADLRSLLAEPDLPSGHEVKLNGRFAMGACQGRFCAANVATLMNELRPAERDVGVRDLTGQRWPVRPVAIGALIRPHDEPDQ